VTFRLKERAVRAILLDIEGTTTPVAFVYDVLFPFARAHLREYLQEHVGSDAVRDVLVTLREEWRADVAARQDPPEWPPEWADDALVPAVAYLEWLMDRDLKSPALKLLQGYIWEGGYRSGVLKGLVFPDVRPAFERWRGVPVTIAIYSSGSVLAQRLLFGATPDGDLTPFIAGFFDTDAGVKTSPESYRRIAGALSRAAADILFVSDAPAELDAARSAGCQVLLAERPGNRAVTASDAETINSFDEIV
jgi:enolase-phosphatase E1